MIVKFAMWVYSKKWANTDDDTELEEKQDESLTESTEHQQIILEENNGDNILTGNIDNNAFLKESFKPHEKGFFAYLYDKIPKLI